MQNTLRGFSPHFPHVSQQDEHTSGEEVTERRCFFLMIHPVMRDLSSDMGKMLSGKGCWAETAGNALFFVQSKTFDNYCENGHLHIWKRSTHSTCAFRMLQMQTGCKHHETESFLCPLFLVQLVSHPFCSCFGTTAEQRVAGHKFSTLCNACGTCIATHGNLNLSVPRCVQ